MDFKILFPRIDFARKYTETSVKQMILIRICKTERSSKAENRIQIAFITTVADFKISKIYDMLCDEISGEDVYIFFKNHKKNSMLHNVE